MISAIDITKRIEFVSSLDKGDEKTVFVLGILPTRTKIELMSQSTTEQGFDSAKLSSRALDIVKAGLKEIRGLKRVNGGSEIITAIDEKVLELIPVEIIAEIASKIIEINFVSEQEEKN